MEKILDTTCLQKHHHRQEESTQGIHTKECGHSRLKTCDSLNKAPQNKTYCLPWDFIYNFIYKFHLFLFFLMSPHQQETVLLQANHPGFIEFCCILEWKLELSNSNIQKKIKSTRTSPGNPMSQWVEHENRKLERKKSIPYT